jgi:hypothetical protein
MHVVERATTLLNMGSMARYVTKKVSKTRCRAVLSPVVLIRAVRKGEPWSWFPQNDVERTFPVIEIGDLRQNFC